MEHSSRRSRSIAVGRGRLLLTIAAVVAVSALSLAPSAMAEPKGIFTKFKNCPTADPEVVLCQYGETTSGEFAIGSTKVPISTKIIQQGGAISAGSFNTYYLLPPIDGAEALSKSEQNVPGGLTDIINCKEIKGEGIFEKIIRGTCESIFENKYTGVTATTELVANEHNPVILQLGDLVFEKGTAVTLPVRVHLKNPLLGESCYIGSEKSPIELHLTTGTTSPPEPNKPIKGKKGTELTEVENELEVNNLLENSLVDNAFSVPVAEGCGGFFSGIIDPVVDLKLGLESKAGHNTAILNGEVSTAFASSVVESEK